MRIEAYDGDNGQGSLILDCFAAGKEAAYKFVMTDAGEGVTAHVFMGYKHYPVFCQLGGLQRPELFVGAGGGKGIHTGWDSESCRRALHRDRPTDSTEADRLLAEFRSSIESLFHSSTSSSTPLTTEQP